MPTIEIKVRGYHLDVYGHVNNARYLEFLEEARWAVFDEIGNLDSLIKEGHAVIMVNINIDYRKPAYLNDILRVKTRFVKFGTRSVTLRQTIRNRATGATVVDADIVFVISSIEEQKAVVLDEDLKAKIRQVFGS